MTVRGSDQRAAADAALTEGTLPLGFDHAPGWPNRLQLICRRPRTSAPGLRARFTFDLTNPIDAGELLLVGRRGGVCIDIYHGTDDRHDDEPVVLGTVYVAAGRELARMLIDIASTALKNLLPDEDDVDADQSGNRALGELVDQIDRQQLRPGSASRVLLITDPTADTGGIEVETADPPTTMQRFFPAQKRRTKGTAGSAALPLRPLYDNGFVYVQRNPAFPEMLKIGYSQRLSEDRANELSRTWVPFPFEVVYRAVTSHAADVERAAHRLLTAHRVAPNREFFRVSAQVAEDAIRFCQEMVTGIGSWTPLPEVHQLRAGDRVTLPLKAGQLFLVTAHQNPLTSSAHVREIWQAHANGDVLELHVTHDAGAVRGFSDNDPGAAEDPVPFLNRDGTAHNGWLVGSERLTPGDRLTWLSDQDGPSILHGSVVFEVQAYCQVIRRTWNPQPGPDGTLEFYDVTRPATPAIDDTLWAVRELGVPRTWAPRDPADEWVRPATRRTRPEEWLLQLKQRRRA